MNQTEAYSDCLRPAFTESLVKKLVDGATINLIGQHGQGRRRTVADVRKHLPESLRVLYVDMKSYRHSYGGFVGALWQQCNQTGEAPAELSGLLASLEGEAKRILFILHNFDALREYVDLDPQYNPRFFDHLNSIKNRPDMALLVVSEKAHGAFLQKGDGGDLPGSTLDALSMALPEISHEQLRQELHRRALPLAEADVPAMVTALLNSSRPCDLLNHFCAMLEVNDHAEETIQLRMKHWIKTMPKESAALQDGTRLVRATDHQLGFSKLWGWIEKIIALWRGGK